MGLCCYNGPRHSAVSINLGIGVAAAARKCDSSLSGFIVTLASVFPILGVLILAFIRIHGTHRGDYRKSC